jgi:SAM-dependent methyltransferase
MLAAARRWLDLQAASIWRDAVSVLPQLTGTLLDVGCGGQPFRRLLPPHVRYIGIDIVDAQARFGYQTPDTLYFSGDTWPVDTARADAILCTETLEHVLDPQRFLGEAARCLRPGGLLFMTIPFAARWHFVPHDYWRFTPSSLSHLLEGAGFGSIEIYARGNAVTVACYNMMALIIPLLMPQDHRLLARAALPLIGLTLSPVLVLCAAIAHLSLRGRGGDDCLGYSVVALRMDPGSP